MLFCLLLLAAAPTDGAHARTLAAARSWDELYLAFSAKPPESISRGDRAVVARALQQGCKALAATDPVLAASLGERSALFSPTEEALLCFARAAIASDQRGAAEEALRRGRSHFPRSAALALELGKLLFSEGDAKAAVEALEDVPPKALQFAEARRLLFLARAALDAKEEAKTPAGQSKATDSLSYESGSEADLRTRTNRRFRLKYFNGARDFGQRADYEGKVVEALDLAFVETQRILGEAREEQVEVILYSAEEFATHFGGRAGVTVAGFYSEGAIRMNDSAEITPENTSTLVHEYTHAAVDVLCDGHDERLPVWMNEGLAEYVQWRHEGREGPDRRRLVALKAAANAGQEPKITQMGVGTPLISLGSAHLRYDASAVAVRTLLGRGGVKRLLELFRDLAAGQPLDPAFERHYGQSLEKYEEEVRDELRRL